MSNTVVPFDKSDMETSGCFVVVVLLTNTHARIYEKLVEKKYLDELVFIDESSFDSIQEIWI